VKSFDLPSFDGWHVGCETCSAPREVDVMKERDAGTRRGLLRLRLPRLSFDRFKHWPRESK